MITGNVDLDIGEATEVWSHMFKDKNIFYFRASSTISPDIWADEFMDKYQGDQRTLIDHLENQRAVPDPEYQKTVGSLENTRFVELVNNLEQHFERIFVLKNAQLANPTQLVKLVRVIHSQAQYMSVSVTHENRFQQSDVRDFGIAVFNSGDTVVYELAMTPEDALYGGKITNELSKIDDSLSRYNRLRAHTTLVKREATFDNVLDAVSEVARINGKPIPSRLIEEVKAKPIAHKCVLCFLMTEVITGTLRKKEWGKLSEDAQRMCQAAAKRHQSRGGDWRRYPTDEEKSWFRIAEAENNEVVKYAKEKRPRRIIEIGSGTGRLMALILNELGDDYDQAVAVDGDQEMYEILYHRFPESEYPKVDVYYMTVRNKLPYVDEDFDLCINAMNIVGWQDDEVAWLKTMLKVARNVLFSVYQRGKEKKRVGMYKTRPHRDDGVVLSGDNGNVQLVDCATNPGVFSKAYTHDQVDRLCRSVATLFEPEYDVQWHIDSSDDLLHFCRISKEPREDLTRQNAEDVRTGVGSDAVPPPAGS